MANDHPSSAHSYLVPGANEQTGWLWLAEWHVPRFLKRALPGPVAHALRAIKARAITKDLPRYLKFEQSLEDADASALMSIIVPVHDAPEETRRCFSSLQKHAPEAEIIIVDDASRLSKSRKIMREFSVRNGWTVVHHGKSLGHSESCRTGARLATRPFLCLLNSDTVVTPWCWRRIKRVFEDDHTIGVAGPSTSNCGTRQQLPLASSFRFYWNDNQICAFAERLQMEVSTPVLIELDWVSGFALFIRRNLWEKLGGFDRYLKDYGNEVELCKRAQNEGYRTVWVRDCYIHHLGQRSYTDVIGEDGIFARIRDAEAYFVQKYHSSKP
jgi:GT2 family glycosyltransferase